LENASSFPCLEPKKIWELEVVFMKRKQKITEFFFNEQDDMAEVFTYNTNLKKRLLTYAQTYPQLCQLTEEDENGGLRFEIDKRRISIRLTAPYSEERRSTASKRGKEIGFGVR
jgi:hypothetical protein